MPVLNIGGQKIKVGDDFLRLTPEEQNATVEEIAKSLNAGVARETPAAPVEAPAAPAGTFTGNRAVRAFSTGVPVIGGALNKMNAATNALLAPLVEPFLEKGPNTLDQPTLGERYAKSLEIQEGMDKQSAAENPISTTAANVLGGVAGTVPLVLRFPQAMGAVGTLGQQVLRGAGSGAGLGVADAAVRGEDVGIGGLAGGALGAGAPMVGKAIGAGVRALRPAPAAIPRTINVAGTDVPVPEATMPGATPAMADVAEQARTGALGDAAKQMSDELAAKTAAGMDEASARIAAGLDPSGAAAATTPQVAGARVVDDLAARRAALEAQEEALARQVAAEGEQVRAQVGGRQTEILADSPYTAAEAVGTGVTRARDVSRRETGALYDAVRDAPGVVGPEAIGTYADDVVRALGAGENPVWIDPQSTPVANRAVRLMGQDEGFELFRNAVQPGPPVGPVAQAIRRAEAERMPAAPPAAPAAPVAAAAADNAATLAELERMGVNPVRARAAVAGMEGGPAAPHTVAAPGFPAVEVRPKVVEAASLKTSADPGYDMRLQNRDRLRAQSSAQVQDISENANPARLGRSAEADRGAPIAGADMQVESGNGRVMGLRLAYAKKNAAAARYRQALADQGFDVAGMREPILIRERVTPMSEAERIEFARAANSSSTLSLSASERALSDSRLLKPETLALIRNPADIGAVENRDFVRAFMQGVPQAERGALTTAGGDLSAEGLARVRNAVLAKAYGDTPILARIAESTDDQIKGISNALTAAAPEWATLRSMAASGVVPAELDVTADLIDAVARTARARGKGVGLEASQAQADAFAQQSPESKIFQRLFYDADGKKAASAGQVANGVRNYAQEAVKVDAAPGLGLGLPPVTATDILENTARKVGAPKELAREVTEAAAAKAAIPEGGAIIPEVTLRGMDQARKRLVAMYGDARAASFGPSGSKSDERAMRRILEEFDNTLLRAFDEGRFSGDSEAAKGLLKAARASHSEYRQTFTSRGGQDPIGRAVEKILGRYSDTAATPDQIMALSYGPANNIGGGNAIQVAQRLKPILGETSPEWGAFKQGLFSYLRDVPEGTAARSPAQIADRIDKYLTGAQGRGHAQVVLDQGERDALRTYARNLRATEPVKVTSPVDKVMRAISGADSGIPYTPDQVLDLLMKPTGKHGNVVPVIQQLQRDLSPESWNALRVGQWKRLTQSPGERADWGPQKLVSQVGDFLETDRAKALYSPAELAQMSQYVKLNKQLIPRPGSTNPSGTAPMIAKLVRGSSNNIFAMLGGVQGGFAGLAMGAGMDAARAGIQGARNVRATRGALYPKQPKVPIRTSRVPIVLSQGLAPQANQ